ncbi:30S ribosomal protein S5 [candidate division WWE3 bacterium]|uniref:Small ribosomal subunit protein uS5 n=1 Tax=candidate division WWE3 bacterium TaxID=2053526 RepID=A0A955RRQ1_UNCKA|nr:30S ribosomal protein S5 [candidate division WWE3 bacterium]
MNDKFKDNNQEQEQEYEEVVVEIKRTSKKTKGGDRLGFTCLAVVGDKAGQVGAGLGKAPSVRPAIQKAMRKAKNSMVSFPLVGKAKTIPHEIEVANGASRIMLKPAPAGTGIRAGGAVRSVLEVAGVANVVAKRLGSSNKKANVDTTISALTGLKDPSKRVYKKTQKSETKSKKK